jgi:hypothetical protein
MPGSMPFIFCPTILTQALRARLADDLGGWWFHSCGRPRRASRGRAGIITTQAPFRITLFGGRSFFTAAIRVRPSALRLQAAHCG